MKLFAVSIWERDIVGALLGSGLREDFLSCLYRLIGSYEQGNWDEVERLSQAWGISTAAIGRAYIDSTVWTEQVMREAPPVRNGWKSARSVGVRRNFVS